MGMQSPLTAQALGRSPYDEVVEGEGPDGRDPAQQYDHGGRPINPETIRINRDIIRSHNQVMLVIGVAEPENPNIGQEVDSQRRHEAHEESIGLKLACSAKFCVEAVGIFGVNGLRERILIYKRYSNIPFWELYQQARTGFSFSKDVLTGAPASFLTNYVELSVSRLWLGEKDKTAFRRCAHEVWSYFRVHLELYVAMQRLGLIPSNRWFPHPSYFIPFSEASPIIAPPLPSEISTQSILCWVGGLFVSSTPFLVWVLTQRMVRDWRPQIWAQVFKCLPTTAFSAKTLPAPPPPPPPSSSMTQSALNEANGGRLEPTGDSDGTEEIAFASAVIEARSSNEFAPVEVVRRPSVFSARGDDYGSDEDENEGVRATLISFDVEATESTDAPPGGLWSAELRPSLTDPRGGTHSPPAYLDTLLTQLPALMASHILTNAVTRLLMTPYEATALRLIARTFRIRRGMTCADIRTVNLLSGINWTSCNNYLMTELLHLVFSAEVWAMFTGVSQWFHMSQEQWKEEEGNDKKST